MSKPKPEPDQAVDRAQGELSDADLEGAAGGIATRLGIQMTLEDDSEGGATKSPTTSSTAGSSSAIRTASGIILSFDDDA